MYLFFYTSINKLKLHSQGTKLVENGRCAFGLPILASTWYYHIIPTPFLKQAWYGYDVDLMMGIPLNTHTFSI